MNKIILKITFLSLAFVFINVNLFSQTALEDEVLGAWWFSAKKATIKFVKEGDVFHGTVISGKRKVKEDVHNPDPVERELPLVGKVILNDLKFTKKRTWSKGTIYDPDNGKTFSCSIEMKNINTLEVTGYRGIQFFGKTFTLTRVSQ